MPVESDRYPFGAIDAKVSSVKQASDHLGRTPVILAKMGPTTNNQPPFCWSQFENNRNKRGGRFFHNGQPKCFDYGWQIFPPTVIDE
jgi:hypothetical protein